MEKKWNFFIILKWVFHLQKSPKNLNFGLKGWVSDWIWCSGSKNRQSWLPELSRARFLLSRETAEIRREKVQQIFSSAFLCRVFNDFETINYPKSKFDWIQSGMSRQKRVISKSLLKSRKNFDAIFQFFSFPEFFAQHVFDAEKSKQSFENEIKLTFA